jgi:hypothetical protein
MTKFEREVRAEMAENVGTDIYRIVATGMSVKKVGALVLSLVDATVKAALPGRQSAKNAKLYTTAGRKAFARKLARKSKP